MMKKKVLSLAVAGALLGGVGAANAALQLEEDGIGSILLIPYFSTQNGNSTLLNVVNTDTSNGKAVKIRFRGGRDSDDIYDFQLFLSPGDVWTANLSQNASGITTLNTTDNSCTLPAKSVLNATPFVTSRLATADGNNGTREGYVELFVMANLPSGTTTTSPVYATTKHASTGIPTCATAVLENIEQNGTYNAADETVRVAGATTNTLLTAPTSGLFANWTIINVPQTTVFTGVATAIQSNAVVAPPATGTRIVYSRQTSDAVAPTTTSTAFPNIASTHDGVLLTSGFTTAEFDFPDLSTPYELGVATAGAQAYQLSSAIAHNSLVNEFLLDASIGAKTDWLVSMPTRRYLVAGRGNTSTGVTAAATGTYASGTAFVVAAGNAVPATDTHAGSNVYNFTADVTVSKAGAQGWFRGVTTYAADGRSSCVSIGNYSQFDREEQSNVTSNVVVSPNIVTSVALCGETNILSLNGLTTNTAAVGANLVVAGLTIPYSNGWSSVNLDAAGHAGGLPVIGYAFVKATNPAVAAGVSGTFGGTWAHRW